MNNIPKSFNVKVNVKTEENPVQNDMMTEIKKFAKTTKQFYDVFIEVGFTPDQSLELVKSMTMKKN